MEELTGYIERITFQSEENGYTVLQLKCQGHKDLICCVGHFPSANIGETLYCQGVWKRHPTHGLQFEVKHCQVKAPATLLGIKKYLGSGLIKGIGPGYAARIVEQFGIQSLTIIDETPERLREVKGLGSKRIEKIKLHWAEQKVVRDIMVFLQGHGISPAFAQKIFKIYGENCIQMVQANPYRLAREVFGIGFKTADKIAVRLGISKDSPARLDAGIEFALRELSEEGHVCYPEVEFLPFSSQMLEVPTEWIEKRLGDLQSEGRIERFDLLVSGEKKKHLWFKPLFLAEIGIAKELERIRKAPSTFRQVDTKRAIKWAQDHLSLQFAPAQSEAIERSLENKIHIVTGGPGTGKSTITKAILSIYCQLTEKISLAAPTGRAAKRMSEITGKQASTLHALLEFDFKNGGFKRKREFPLECDLLIVDESSMIDTTLMYQLLRAVPSHARIILIGDVNQLPSVGPGNVLLDMIRSMQIQVSTLKDIYRQAHGSQIIVNAHRINQGQFPNIRNQSNSDFFFIEAETPEKVLQEIVKLVAERLPKKYGFHAIDEIQVLAPMKRGVIGTENLNAILQEHLNPKQESLFKAGRKFQRGDKVMQIRNNYKKMVFNGDIGRILHIDLDEQLLAVKFEEREVIYEFSELDEIVLAYAVTVHKYQGSERRCVVIPIHTAHYKQLVRNLLYTGVTRGKELVVIVGTKKALALAVKNDEVKHRYTGLKEALLGILL